jgi:hypothetical protein
LVPLAFVPEVAGVPAEAVPVVRPPVEGVPVPPVDGTNAVPVPDALVAIGGSVCTGAFVGVAAVEQADKIRTNTARIPNSFGYFIDFLLLSISLKRNRWIWRQRRLSQDT